MIFPHVALGEICDAAVWFLFQTFFGVFFFVSNHTCSLTGVEPSLRQPCGSQFRGKEELNV